MPWRRRSRRFGGSRWRRLRAGVRRHARCEIHGVRDLAARSGRGAPPSDFVRIFSAMLLRALPRGCSSIGASARGCAALAKAEPLLVVVVDVAVRRCRAFASEASPFRSYRRSCQRPRAVSSRSWRDSHRAASCVGAEGARRARHQAAGARRQAPSQLPQNHAPDDSIRLRHGCAADREQVRRSVRPLRRPASGFLVALSR